MPENAVEKETAKVALVTGGSRGIGRAVCLRLAACGLHIAVNYAGNAASAERTASECRAYGIEAIAVPADVSRADQVDCMVDRVLGEFGRIDVLVNNAGITRDGLAVRLSERDFDEVVNVNLKGSFLCMKAVARIMLKQRSGRIVNVSSVVGLHGNAGQINYAASKGGIIAATKTLARELASRGITVNAIAPGFIETDMTASLSDAVIQHAKADIPLGRFGSPDDVARAVVFLASDAAAYITGQVLGVDGGMGM